MNHFAGTANRGGNSIAVSKEGLGRLGEFELEEKGIQS